MYLYKIQIFYARVRTYCTCNIILIQYHTTLCTLFMILIIEKQPELSSNYKDEGHCPMTTTPNTLPVIKNDFGIYGFDSLLPNSIYILNFTICFW